MQPGVAESGAGMRVCTVWIDSMLPSIRHLPHLLQIKGRRCFSMTLERLRAGLGEGFEYELVCDSAGAAQVKEEAERLQVRVFVTEAETAAEALREYWKARPEMQVALFFQGQAVLSSCEMAKGLLSAHLAGGALATVAVGMPSGLAPVGGVWAGGGAGGEHTGG